MTTAPRSARVRALAVSGLTAIALGLGAAPAAAHTSAPPAAPPAPAPAPVRYLWTDLDGDRVAEPHELVTLAGAGAASTSSYDQLVAGARPVAYFPLDGQTQDLGSGAHTLTYQGAPTRTSLPNGDAAMQVDGSGQYAEIADADDLSIPTTGVLTVEAWMRPDALQFPDTEAEGYVHWLGKGTPGAHEYVFRIYNRDSARPNRISAYAYNARGGLGAGSYSQTELRAGEWVHVAAVYDTVNRGADGRGTTRIYVNGQLRDTDSLGAPYHITPTNGGAALRIGTRDGNSFFRGGLAKVAVYDRDVSAELPRHVAAMRTAVGTGGAVAAPGR